MSHVIKVSAKSNVNSVAESITKSLEENKTVEVTAIGAGALNQAVKAAAISRSHVASKGYDLIVRPGFGDTVIDGEERTTIRLVVSIM